MTPLRAAEFTCVAGNDEDVLDADVIEWTGWAAIAVVVTHDEGRENEGDLEMAAAPTAAFHGPASTTAWARPCVCL